MTFTRAFLVLSLVFAFNVFQSVLSQSLNSHHHHSQVDLGPRFSKEVFSSDGGSFHKWFASEQPMLRIANAGGSKLILHKNGLLLPHYSDSSKAAYVLKGYGRVGIVFPEQKEKVILIKRGDAIIVPYGAITWWFNENNEHLEILFLGETSKAYKSGEFTDTFLAGTNGIFSGLSTEFASRAWDLEEDMVRALLKNQTGHSIVKLSDGTKLPKANKADRDGIVVNCIDSKPDIDIKDGGHVVNFNENNLPLAKEVGFGGDLVTLDKHAMCSPGFSSDSAYQITHIVRGSGRAEVVGTDGKRVLEIEVKPGYLFIVPRFHVVSKIAGKDGLQWFSIVTSPKPVFNQLGGSTSVWKAFSPQVIEASFNVTSDLEKLLRSKRNNVQVFFPPKK